MSAFFLLSTTNTYQALQCAKITKVPRAQEFILSSANKVMVLINTVLPTSLHRAETVSAH